MDIKLKQNVLVLIISIGYQVFCSSAWQDIHTSFYWKIANYLMYVAIYFLAAYETAFMNFNKKRAIFFVVLTSLIIIGLLKGQTAAVMVFIYCALAINMSTRDLISAYLVALIIAILMVIVLCVAGILPSYTEAGLLAWGFRNPNALGFYLALIFLLGQTLVTHSNWIINIVAFILVLVVYLPLNDHTASLMIILGLVLGWCSSIFKYKIINICISTMPLFFTGLVFWIGHNYTNYAWMPRFNDFFTLRPMIWHFYFDNFPVTWLGTAIPDMKLIGFGAFDGAYAFYTITFGILFISTVVGALTWSLKKTLNSQNYYLTILLLVLTLAAVSENTPFIGFQSPLIPLAFLICYHTLSTKNESDGVLK
ncbi:hypothetical protein [Bombilactobacillus thymidiniphilus]|uniref:Oligosaccharide repeat unit polymerase n=1 Tax=Bombilactobacillus thymidiniphilus TaxID=2923363 RepID=A0ABY4PBZ6_9LACO|nr:hypothetical protein [Bombilactobacillus thymidiniphilus]UQS83293.1 hypothetical protein MOO47_05815 [Bombilactobacillus thymidiniphilus]